QRGGLRVVSRTNEGAQQRIEPVEPTRVAHGKHRQRQRDFKKILKVTSVAARRRRVEPARVAEDTLEGVKLRQSIDLVFCVSVRFLDDEQGAHWMASRVATRLPLLVGILPEKLGGRPSHPRRKRERYSLDATGSRIDHQGIVSVLTATSTAERVGDGGLAAAVVATEA